jgi:hypothetical protein
VGYRSSIFNPRDRALGLVVYPYFLLVELLAPVVEAVGLIGLTLGLLLGAVDTQFAIAFFLFAYAFGMLLSLLAVLLDTSTSHPPPTKLDLLRLTLWSVLEPLGYRQLTVWWRLRGLLGAVRGRQDWGGHDPPRLRFRDNRIDVVADVLERMNATPGLALAPGDPPAGPSADHGRARALGHSRRQAAHPTARHEDRGFGLQRLRRPRLRGTPARGLTR